MRSWVLGSLVLVLFSIAPVMSKEPKLDWWETTIFYQIYPRSFKDSDGDGIGDLNGVISRLQYLKDIGVGATWLSPIFKSPMYDFGYDIADFYAIHDEYGTINDFKKLLKNAKKLDIKIILDLVPNHTSNESEWFKAALRGDKKYYNYFVWEDGRIDENGELQPPNNWVSVYRKSAWEYRKEVGKFYLHQFVIGQPDLNYRNPDVVAEMKNVMRFWLDMGVAGFRVDAVNFLFEEDKGLHNGIFPDEPVAGRMDLSPDDYDYLLHIYTKDLDETCEIVYQFRDVLDEYKAKDGFSRIMMTDVYASIQYTVKYFGDGDRLGAQIPFNYALVGTVDSESTAHDIKYLIDRWMTYKPVDKNSNWVLGNHDNHRVASLFSPELVDGLNMIVLLLPGVAVTYMGEEIGMIDGYVSWEDTVDPGGCNTDDPLHFWMYSRDPMRTPFQWNSDKNAGFSTADKTWLPVEDGYETLNMEAQKAADKSNYHVYRALATLRKEPAFKYGRYESLAFNKDILVFRRWYKNDIYLVVINMKDTAYDIDLGYFENVSGKLKVSVTSSQSSKKVGDVVKANAVHVAGDEALVLKQL